MTKADIVKKISSDTGIIRKDTAIIVDTLFETVKDLLDEGEHIEVRGFGTFKIKERKARKGRNPRKPDEEIVIPKRKVPTFKFSKSFRDKIANIKK